MNNPVKVRLALVASVSLAVTGCAVGPAHIAPDVTKSTGATQWYATVSAETPTVSAAQFWRGWNDAALIALIEGAAKNATSLEQAQARIAQARATAGIVRSGALPVANGSTSLSRGDQGQGAATVFSGAMQAAWELDLFGANRRNREAADARLQARERDLLDARTSLAADVATLYVNLRTDEALLVGFERDAASRAETERLTQLKVKAGFEAPANAALAAAAASDARTRVASQRAQIDLEVKSLVALTALTEPEVRTILKPGYAQLLSPPKVTVESIPAQVLARRADLASLERELAAAIADIGAAEADRYPKITLTGSIGYSAARAFGATNDGVTWGFGPSLSIPLFDAGRRAANVELAKARHAELTASYRASALRAVSEVEQALTQVDSVQKREDTTRAAWADYEAFAKAAEARLKAGIGSVLELEDARRAVLAAQLSVLNLERERMANAIALFRAVGGDWGDATSATTLKPDTATSAAPSPIQKPAM